MGGGKTKTPKVETVTMPEAATPAPPPETAAQAPETRDEGALRHKDRDAKKKGTGALRIDLSVNNSGAAVPGSGSGLSIPR